MDIKKIVTDYIKAENTDYAIMVTGVWGSGKTFFWNHTLKQAIEEIKSHDEYAMEQERLKQQKNEAFVPGQPSRHLKVYETSGYKYKPTPTIMLKGEWLRA